MSNKQDLQKNIDKIGQNFLLKLKDQLAGFEDFLESVKAGKVNKKLHEESLFNFHKISGSAKIFGFKDLGEIAALIENALKEKLSAQSLKVLEGNLLKFIEIAKEYISKKLKSKKQTAIKVRSDKNCKFNIIIAEDNDLVRDLVRQAVQEIDCSLVEAEDGISVLKMVKSAKKPFDLIILDVNMPKKNGFEVLEELKEDVKTKEIPVVMLTRRNEDESVAKGISSGATDYITKPFKVEVIASRITEILQHVKQKILVADDDKLIRDLLTGHFQRLGYIVINAKNGKEALKIINDGPIDIAIIDCMMPAVDGMSVLKQVRSGKKVPKLPIILLTAKSQQENILQGLKNGANDYVTKPFDIEELSARVLGILQND